MGTIIDLFKDKRDVFANLRQDASGYGWNLIPRDLGKELFEELRGGDNHDYVTVLVFSDDKVQPIDYIPVGTDKPTMKSAETMVDLKDYVVDNAPEGKESHVLGESDVLLRTQTSGVQVHVMENRKPPIYMICPGTVFRPDTADANHLPQFTQVEGLVVDEGITFGDLKGTLDYFTREIFGKDRATRYRPHFFPFTEPSCEVDVSCGVCGGKGCRFCNNTGWIEILGCGMVDPNVFRYCGIDPEKYTGFAFGIGVERVAALRYDLPDLRMLMTGDMRFLRQF